MRRRSGRSMSPTDMPISSRSANVAPELRHHRHPRHGYEPTCGSGLPATGRAGSVADLDPRVSPRRRAARRARPGPVGRSRDRRRRRALPSRPGEDLRRWCGPPACDGRIDGQRIQFGDILPGIDDHIRVAVARGFGVAVHAIGNVGLSSALDSWRTATAGREPEHGMRVEHVLLASSTELDEMRRLGVTGVIQPGLVVGLGDVGTLLTSTSTPGFLRGPRQPWHPPRRVVRSPCTDTVAPIPLSRLGVHRQTISGKTIGPEQSLPLDDVAAALDGGSGRRGRAIGRTRPDPPGIAR